MPAMGWYYGLKRGWEKEGKQQDLSHKILSMRKKNGKDIGAYNKTLNPNSPSERMGTTLPLSAKLLSPRLGTSGLLLHSLMALKAKP